MDILEWAKKEIELASAKERDEAENSGWNYAISCYESAYRAFERLANDNHSGMSILITQNILNSLIAGRPLTPIEDTPDVWVDASYPGSEYYASYQCTRMSSLFKHVLKNGTIIFNDINRVVCTCNPDSAVCWSSGFVTNIINQKYPITLPYMPESKPYVCTCTEALYDEQNGDYDTLAVWYVNKPDGSCDHIDRFFKESSANHGFVEITQPEYSMRVRFGKKL